MQPADFPLEIYRGDSGHWQFKLWADTARTTPVDLTGVVAKSEIRDKPMGGLITPLDCAITLPNIIDVRLTSQESYKLTAKGGSWDLQLTYPSNEVVTPLAGAVAVTPDVTDSAPAPTLLP
jgi:hypothetical protein